MRKFKADYSLGGKKYSFETVAEKVKLNPTVDGHSMAEFTIYDPHAGTYDLVSAFEFSTLISLESEKV